MEFNSGFKGLKINITSQKPNGLILLWRSRFRKFIKKRGLINVMKGVNWNSTDSEKCQVTGCWTWK